MKFYILTIYLLYTIVFPLGCCLAGEFYPALRFRKHPVLWLAGGGLFSWGFINAVLWVPIALNWYIPRGPEVVFALFFGWCYLFVASLPVLAVYWCVKMLCHLVRRDR